MEAGTAQGYAFGAFVLTRLADGVEVDDDIVVHIFTILLNLVLIMTGSFSLQF